MFSISFEIAVVSSDIFCDSFIVCSEASRAFCITSLELEIVLSTLFEISTSSITVFDAAGKLMTEKNNISLNRGEQLITVDTEKFKPGHYFYVVELFGNTSYKTSGTIIKSY